MHGFFNKALRIDLSTRTFKEETIPDSVYETHLGGKGVGTYFLMKENPPGVDPLSPKNKLIFCIGPATDSRIYGSCRHGVFTKSPLTGIFSESYAGGKAAEPMSRTGYDAFIFEEAPSGAEWIEIEKTLRSGVSVKKISSSKKNTPKIGGYTIPIDLLKCISLNIIFLTHRKYLNIPHRFKNSLTDLKKG